MAINKQSIQYLYPFIEDGIKQISRLMQIPTRTIMQSYDYEADVLYISFGKPREATNSEITEDNIIIRYLDSEIIGLTILNASSRERFDIDSPLPAN